MVGIQKVECLDNYLLQLPKGMRDAAIEFGTEFEAPIYIYRGKVSSTNVLGVIHPFKGDLSAISNYGLVGSNAHLKSGPGLEGKVLKVFFYQGPDGISFYTIQNKAGFAFATKSRVFISTKKVSLPNNVLLSNDPGDLILIDSPLAKRVLDLPMSTRLYDGEFSYNGRTAGGIIGYFEDLGEVREWEVIFDPMDTGDLVMIKAADGKDNTEVVLAQGPVKIDFDYSLLRQPVGNENLKDDDPSAASAYGNLYSVDISGDWWREFIGQESTATGQINPYSLFDGTSACSPNCREPDMGGGLSLATISLIKDQNIRWWRDFEPRPVNLVGNAGINEWYKIFQSPKMVQIYSRSEVARSIVADISKPIIVNDLRVLCSAYAAEATTFSVTLVDSSGNYFEFPDRTIRKNSDNANKFSWVSFGPPTSNEVVVIESDPSTLESPPTGTIIGTKVTGDFKKTFDLGNIARLIIDIRRAESQTQVLGIQSIAAMLDMPRWTPEDPMYNKEPNAYAIIDAFAKYWRYSVPANGWPALPTNITGRYIDQWWTPAALDQTWHIIPGFLGDSISCASGSKVCNTSKNPIEEIKNNRVIFTTIPPTDGCQMHWKQIEWLERGHRIGASCSFYVEIDGMAFIVVKRSIGIDMSCGGGESPDNPCVLTFGNTPQGHPAIAWPSINGEEFIGKPSSGYITFIKDDELSSKIMDKLLRGEVTYIHGDPNNTIPWILFPSI